MKKRWAGMRDKEGRKSGIAVCLSWRYPDDGETLRKFSSADAQKAATIAVSYGLPKEIMASKPGVCAELVWRTLKARLPEVVGNAWPP